MMVKTDVSVLFKTKLCKKYSSNGYCPYGQKCQFIHDISEAAPEVRSQIEQQIAGNKFFSVVTEKNLVLEPEKEFAPVVEEVSMTVSATPAFSILDSSMASISASVHVHQKVGAFGNKSANFALQAEKLDFSEIVLHNLNVSIQEFQKKTKMFQKKATGK